VRANEDTPMTRQPLREGAGTPARGDLAQLLRGAFDAYRSGNLAQAAWLCGLILAAKRDHFEALHLRGIVEIRQGRLEDARRSLASAVKVNPRSADAHNNLALTLNALEGPAAALPNLNAALKLRPDDAAALNNRGNALWRVNRHQDALADLDRAVTIAPNYGDALTNRGNVLSALQRYEEALASFDRSLALNPTDALAWHNRGNALWQLKRPDEALESYDRSLSINPADILVMMDRGRLLLKLDRFDDALATIDKVLAIAPGHFPALYLRGIALMRLKRLDEAVEAFDRCLTSSPDDHQVLMNRGNALGELGRFNEALADFRRSLELSPDNADVHWNRSLVYLRFARFDEGWRDYEWRFRKQDSLFQVREFPQPRWHGNEPLEGRTILLHTEQGLGDTIQFAPLATLLANRGANVVMEVQPSLKDLLSCIEGVARVVGTGEELPHIDCHCPLLSLPLELNVRLDAPPCTVPYLVAPGDRLRKWEMRLPRSGAKRIAVAWAGSQAFSDDHNRTIGLKRILPLLAESEIECYSIQKALRPGDSDILKHHPQVMHLGDEIDDFCDTAAVISLMDLVISSDTSVVHLAGALGTPVWILLQYAADWRWLLDRDDCPWYPSARLFRQPRIGDWSAVVERVCSELAHFAAGKERLETQ
jgi:tetratricopeptide (TPR) repeat protein